MASMWRRAGTYLDLVYTFPAIILAGAALGWLFDRWAGSSPYGTLVGFVAGLVGGFTYILKMLGRLNRKGGDDDP